MLRDNPEIAVRMMRKLSRRLRETDQLLREPRWTRPAAALAEMPRRSCQGRRRRRRRSGWCTRPRAWSSRSSRGSETTIGRKDPVTGIYPDIDLSPVDSQRSVSRRHAKIYRRGAKFFLAEEIGTMNDTFLNGARLETGVPGELKPGDEVRCGVVALRFEIPN